MSTYTQILYQFVFSTKNRDKTLNEINRKELYKYIWGILNKKKCHLYRIGGTNDHIHIVTHVHPTLAPATLIKDIKLASDDFIKKNNLFPQFTGWQNGYGAFTYSIKDKESLINYVIHQDEHHKVKIYQEELIELLNEHGIEFNEKYLF